MGTSVGISGSLGFSHRSPLTSDVPVGCWAVAKAPEQQYPEQCEMSVTLLLQAIPKQLEQSNIEAATDAFELDHFFWLLVETYEFDLFKASQPN